MNATSMLRTEEERLELQIAAARLSVLASLSWLERALLERRGAPARGAAQAVLQARLQAERAIKGASTELRGGAA